MTQRDSVQIDLLLGELKEVIKLAPNDVPALCRIGEKLAAFERPREAGRAYRAAVEALRRAARSGQIQRALEFEAAICKSFVGSAENEDHYRQCFSDWKDDLAAQGRRHYDPDVLSGGGRDRIAFFLHVSLMLGHTEVLLKLLESRPRSGERRVEARVYVLNRSEPAFAERCRAAGVEVVSAADVLGASSTWEARLLWMRQRFKEDGIGVCVWVSVPTLAAYALSIRLAPVQIYWALRFHPISGPDIDGYITWGNADETTRLYGGQEWQVAPLPFAIEGAPPDPARVRELRERFPERVLLGTLAREEKINSAPFLKAVSDILIANPHAGYLWTGRSEHPGIANFFRNAGVSERCHFVGWVDTQLYVSALDVFLESFPYGFGIIGYQAFAAGVPLLSYLDPYTVFGVHYWRRLMEAGPDGTAPGRPRLNAPDEYAILCARDAEEYIALAGRLIKNPDWRKEIGVRGLGFFREELQNNTAYAERFFTTITRIAADKRGKSAQFNTGARPGT